MSRGEREPLDKIQTVRIRGFRPSGVSNGPSTL